MPPESNPVGSDAAKQLLIALRKTKLALAAAEKTQREPIAIVGMGCRFPGGVTDPESYWELLKNGVDAITTIPVGRYRQQPSDIEDSPSRYGSFLPDIDLFDPMVFGISPREASSIDPQQRLLLEVSWEALEHAGYAPERLKGTQTGVFMGVTQNEYVYEFDSIEAIDIFAAMGISPANIAGRLSFLLGLHGPSLVTDTTCSSSLVAIHLACQSLRQQECNMALAGGVHLNLLLETCFPFVKGGALAKDGRCKTFDKKADGFSRGEGCGVIICKRLSDAMADNDQIMAVIPGSAINHDGRSSGLTVPNPLAQAKVIMQALDHAGLTPDQVDYVEAHGTGTPLGDPTEVQALAATICKGRDDNQPLVLGSVKTNFGHLGSAAGISGIIKSVLALMHSEIPPHLHCQQPNPAIPWQTLPIVIPHTGLAWPESTSSKIAGVSSFGMSGTNAHILLQEAPVVERQNQPVEQRPYHILTLSARDPQALQQLLERYQMYLQTHPDSALADICYSANTGRSHFEHRLAIVADSTQQLAEKLQLATTQLTVQSERYAAGIATAHRQQGAAPAKIGFMFTGQGSQWLGMGQQLYQTQAVFRQTLDQCDSILRPYLQQPLLQVLYPESTETGAALLDMTAYAQPALFAIEYALAKLWQAWGVQADWVAGHSVGEYVAACIAGVFSLEDGLQLIAQRGQLMQSVPGDGKMVAVFATLDQVHKILAPYVDQISIAAINAPNNVTLSGEGQTIDLLSQDFVAAGIVVKPLRVSHAFHSVAMHSIRQAFAKVAATVTYHPPQIPLVCNLTGTQTDAMTTPDYWVRHLCEPVQFESMVQHLAQQGVTLFLEIGAKPVLSGLGRQCLAPNAATWLATLSQHQSDWQNLLTSLAQLYTHGIDIDWFAFDQAMSRRKLSLPTYPFQRQRYWVASSQRKDTKHATWLAKTADDMAWAHGFYQLQWQPVTITTPLVTTVKTQARWLIFADTQGVAPALVEQLIAEGDQCCLIYQHDAQRRLCAGEYMLDPTSAEAMQAMLGSIMINAEPAYDGIIHCWSLDLPESEKLTVANLEQAQKINCGSVLHLVQSLVQQLVDMPRLWLVTRGAQTICSDNQPIQLAQTPIWGLGRVVYLEYPELQGAMIDLPKTAATATIASEIQLLKNSIQSALPTALPKEDALVLREGRVYGQRLSKQAANTTQSFVVNTQASYLIVGGTGALGLHVAEWLITQGAKSLILTGRHQASESLLSRLESWQQQDVSVLTKAIDICDQLAMQDLFNEIQTDLLPLKGIVQVAGIADARPIPEIDIDAFMAMQKPKVSGTWVLHQLTQSLTLDFWVGFSSIASVWGSKGLAHYASANYFLDSMAHYRQALDLPGLSINWGPWAGGGMAQHQALNFATRMGLEPLQPKQAMAAFAQLLNLDASCAVVANVDWQQFKSVYDVLGKHPLLADIQIQPDIAADQIIPSHPVLIDELNALPVAAWQHFIETHFREEIANVLALDLSHVDAQHPLTDMGFSSLMAIELKNQFQTKLGVDLPIETFVDTPTIAGLTQQALVKLQQSNVTSTSIATPIEDEVTPVSNEPMSAIAAPYLAMTLKCPQLPLPSLEQTCQRYLEVVKPLLSQQQFQQSQTIVDAFQTNEGPGLQQLLQQYSAMSASGYMHQFRSQSYMADRRPLPILQNGAILAEKVPVLAEIPLTGQIVAIILALWQFYQTIKQGQLQPDQIGGQPLCMSQYPNIFGTTRLPGIKQDTLRYLTAEAVNAEEIIVMYRHAFYVLSLAGKSETTRLSYLLSQIDWILAHPVVDSPAVGVLTTLPRAQWAIVRSELSQTSNNAAWLERIDNALFMVCLDDIVATDIIQNTKNAFYGDGRNRWFDKTLQLIVTNDGQFGLNIDHAPVDGYPISRLGQYIEQNLADILLALAAVASQPEPTEITEPQSFNWTLNAAMMTHIQQSERAFDQLAADYVVEILEYPAWGETLMTQSKLGSVDAIFQLAIQLACYYLCAEVKNVYQPVHTRYYRYGRTEVMRPVTTASMAAIQAIASDQAPADIYPMLQAAVAAHIRQELACAEGGGVDRHLTALHELSTALGQSAEIFQDVGYQTLRQSLFFTAGFLQQAGIQLSVSGPEVAQGYGLSYTVGQDAMTITIVFNKTQCQRLAEPLTAALNKLQTIIQTNLKTN